MYRPLPFHATCTQSLVFGRHYLDLSLGHGLFCFLLPLIAPSGQGGATLNDIANSPQHALLVCLFGDIVIRADNIKFVLFHLLVEEVGHLLGSPCSSWLFSLPSGSLPSC